MVSNRSLYLLNLVLILLSALLFLFFYVVPDHEEELLSTGKRYIQSLKVLQHDEEKSNEVRKIRFMIELLGFEEDDLKEVVKLPKEVAVGISIYSPILESYLGDRNGKQVFIIIPFESGKQDEMGILALSESFSKLENAQRLDAILSKSNGCKGFYFDGDTASLDSKLLYNIYSVVRDRGLEFYYSLPVTQELTALSGVLFPKFIVDSHNNSHNLEASLHQILKDSSLLGSDIDILIRHPSVELLEILKRWMDANSNLIKLISF